MIDPHGRLVAEVLSTWPIAAQDKNQALSAVTTLDFLRVPLGNRLAALKGGRGGQQSIRTNGQFRVCFTWLDGDTFNVEIVDYH